MSKLNENTLVNLPNKQILVLRTNVKTKKKVKTLKPFLNEHPLINSWTVDIEDIDNVLRIEAQEMLKGDEVINILKTCGYYSEMLED